MTGGPGLYQDMRRQGPTGATGPQGATGATGATGAAGAGLVSFANSGIVWPPGAVRSNAGTAMTDNRAYFVFIGKAAASETIARIGVPHTSNGTTSFTGEVGLFTTPNPPTRATGQTLTKVWAAALPDLTSGAGAVRFNSVANSTAHAADAFLWIAFRGTSGGTMPSVTQLIRQWGLGDLLVTDTAGALTSSSTFSGVVTAFSDTAPLLVACKD